MGKKDKLQSKPSFENTDYKVKFKPKLNCNLLKAIFKKPKLTLTENKTNYVTKPKENLVKKLVNEAVVKPVKLNDIKSGSKTADFTRNKSFKTSHPDSIDAETKKIKGKKLYAVSKIKSTSLFSGQKASDRLKGSHFRFLNEKLYTNSGEEALKYFETNPEEFRQYHEGYQTQVSKWPVNPIDLIIEDLQKMPKNLVIADLGCGEAKIAQIFHKRKVHSFDLQPLNEFVTKCDISKVPLDSNSVDIAIFCLSLMGTNAKDFLLEARRILKMGGILKIAEIQSRLKDPEDFVKSLRNMGFKLVKKDLTNKMFSLFEFKLGKRRHKKSSQEISLEPCLYKKR